METRVNNNILDQLMYSKESKSVWSIFFIFTGVLGLILSSKISFPIPFSPVPVTAQTFVILLIGTCYGPRKAIITTSTYISLGLFGLPVFSNSSFGLIALVGPTGGYLFGFVIAAGIMGYLSEKHYDRKFKTSLIIFTIGHVIIFAFGLLGLSRFTSYDKLLLLGFYPFIPGMIFKTMLAALLTPTLWKL